VRPSGRYRLDHLIERYGIDAKLLDWEPEEDCPRRIVRNPYDACGARCPDLGEGGLRARGRFLGFRISLIQINDRKGRVCFDFSQELLSHRRLRMFRATLIAFAAAVMLATAFVPTEASARHGRRSWLGPASRALQGILYVGNKYTGRILAIRGM
jgi:hypothetical protein